MKFTDINSDRELPPKWLVIAWLALPQIAETILAPALPDLARVWQVDPAHTQWVMGIFFVGFAVGVLLWGCVADRFGRRPALLLGLTLAFAGTVGAVTATSYALLLCGRFVQAVGMATCSVTTQTVLRDRLNGAVLTRYFVTLGMVLSWSPAVGPLAGQIVSDQHGYHGVLWVIVVLVLILACCGAATLGETRPSNVPTVSMKALAARMIADRTLWRAAILVAGLNSLVFSFYAAGPFMVGNLSGLGFGWIGLAVALAGSLGAACNRRLPDSLLPDQKVRYGLLCVLGGVMAQLLVILASGPSGVWWAVAALPVFAGFGLAIPNILGPALRDYGACLGRAGALFGLTYYLLLGGTIVATAVLPFDTPVPLCTFWSIVALIMLAVHGRAMATPRAASECAENS